MKQKRLQEVATILDEVSKHTNFVELARTCRSMASELRNEALDRYHCANCEAEMEYRHDKETDTHVFVCDSCSLITFEYYNDKNIEGVRNVIK